MEIGTWNGRRAEKMIVAAKQHRAASEIEYYGFDLFEQMTPEINRGELSKTPPTQAEVAARLQKTGAHVHLFEGFTHDTLPQVVGHLPKMDFIFIDGGHSLETIANDWQYAQELVDDQTVVIFDDYYFDRSDLGAKTMIEKIDPKKYQVEILPIRDRFKKEWGILSINFVRVTRRGS